MRRRPRFVDAAQRIQCGVGCTRTRFVAGSIVEVGACEFPLERVRDALEVALKVRQSLGYLTAQGAHPNDFPCLEAS
jgi:hypothetical protein